MSLGKMFRGLQLTCSSGLKVTLCQKEDFAQTLENMNLTGDVFVRHVQFLWLTLIPAVERLRNNWNACLQAIPFERSPTSQSKQPHQPLPKTNERYKRICQGLSFREMYIQLVFIICCGPLFNTFSKLFQNRSHWFISFTQNRLT